MVHMEEEVTIFVGKWFMHDACCGGGPGLESRGNRISLLPVCHLSDKKNKCFDCL